MNRRWRDLDASISWSTMRALSAVRLLLITALRIGRLCSTSISIRYMCSASLAGRHMIEQGSGKIINIASMLSFQGGINVPGYTASKHAVAGLTKALGNEWASKNVQVNAIAPGYMSTDNTEALREDPVRSKQILDRIPASRWGESEDMMGPAIFLASAASNYMNGHVLCVDGGWMNR